MKYLKTYEENSEDIKVGDQVYCIDAGKMTSNASVDGLNQLKFGELYTVFTIRKAGDGQLIYGIYYDQNNEIVEWFARRFTKDPNHPEILKKNSNKYNL
jgi:hypothetical protein